MGVFFGALSGAFFGALSGARAFGFVVPEALVGLVSDLLDSPSISGILEMEPLVLDSLFQAVFTLFKTYFGNPSSFSSPGLVRGAGSVMANIPKISQPIIKVAKDNIIFSIASRQGELEERRVLISIARLSNDHGIVQAFRWQIKRESNYELSRGSDIRP
jgi:hypothetical protein